MYKTIIFLIYLTYSNISSAQNFINKIELNIDKIQNNTILITTSNQSDYKIFKLDNPDRIVIDILKSKSIIKDLSINSELIKKIRSGIREGFDTRFVIEIKDNIIVSNIRSYYTKQNKNYNLIISLDYQKFSSKSDYSETSIYGVEKYFNIHEKLDTELAKKAPLNLEISNKSNKRQENFSAFSKLDQIQILKEDIKKSIKPIIVIDAGHGGEDPGTIGRYSNIYEKNITLKYAKTLAIMLEKTKLYNVILTRDKDKFITLANRVSKAKEAKADLFLSLHADSHADPNIQGLSVYTISEDKQDLKIEKMKNQLKLITKKSDRDDIKEILDNLVDRKNKNIAIEFASSLISVLGKEVNIVKNSHRFAGFKVLKNEEVPAVLIELGYLSNKQEEKLLVTDKYRTKIINALIMAINHHFEKSNFN